MDVWEASGWAMAEFGEAELGHRARTKRGVQIATELVQSPASSIPKAIGDPAQIKGAYRFLSNPAVTHEGILSGHVRATAKRCLERGTVLVAQDTTTLTFNTRPGLEDAGPTNDREGGKGFFAHSSLAIDAATHEVLGVLHQQVWIRSYRKKDKGETLAQRKKRPRESENWGNNQKRVAESLRKAVEATRKPAPHVIAVFDREGDVFEAMEVLDELGHSFVIRAEHNRLLEEQEPGEKRYSLDEVKLADVRAHKTVSVPARGGKPAREARLAIRALATCLQPPKARKRSGQNLQVHIVLVEEVGAPAGCEPLSWYLLTREPIETEQDVLRVAEHYQARWLIEEMHMGLKTGCGCEKRQMETTHALKNFLGLATPMAVRLLQLRDLARRNVSADECTILGANDRAVLHGLRPRMMAKVATARDLMRVVANLGGFVNRNTDPDPGWRTLWKGFEVMKFAVAGYEVRERLERRAARTSRGLQHVQKSG